MRIAERNDIDDRDYDPRAYYFRRLFKQWQSLSPKHRPQSARDFAWYLWEHVINQAVVVEPKSLQFRRAQKKTMEAYDNFYAAAKDLLDTLPISSAYYVLRSHMARRLPQDSTYADTVQLLNDIEDIIARIVSGGSLASESPDEPQTDEDPDKGGQTVEDLFVRFVVEAVFRYLSDVEKVTPTVSFVKADGRRQPNSRAGLLARSVLLALGHDGSGLKTNLEAVRKNQSWRL